ncbi:MAG: hypothetical protein LBB81_10675 [Treponema sp.]|jgi:hypothetical protein|nr:hypothetical protein [Treponema sp.]
MNISEAIGILKDIKQSLKENYTDDEFKNNKIDALDTIINFSRMMYNFYQNGTVRKMIEQDKIKNYNLLNNIIEKHILNEKIDYNEELVERVYSDEIKLKFNHRLVYSMIKYNDDKYIIIEPKIYNKSMDKWINWQAYKFPIKLFNADEFRNKFKEED